MHWLVVLIGCGSAISTEESVPTPDSASESIPPPSTTESVAQTDRGETTDTGETAETTDTGETAETTDTGVRDTGDTSALSDSATSPVREVRFGPTVGCTDPSRRHLYGAYYRTDLDSPLVEPAALAGSAVVVADLRGDERPEIVLGALAGVVVLERVAADWRDVTDEIFPGATLGDVWTGSAADYDGDGDLDLFLGTTGPHHLLRNDDGVFVDVAPEVGLARTTWHTASSSWADLDRDGDLDLVVGNYAPGPEAGPVGSRVTDPSELYLYEDGAFVDVSDWIPETVHDAYVFMTGWYDVNDDGWPDLITSHDFGLPRNDGHWLLNREGAGLEGEPFLHYVHGMGLAVADIDDDGGLDIAISSASTIVFRTAHPDPTSELGWHWSIDEALARGVDINLPTRGQRFGWGIELADVDNDGDEDLPVVFGWWSEYPDAYPEQHDGIWIQQADGMFVDEADAWGVDDGGQGRGLIVADVTGDGWLDLVKRQLNRPSVLHTARCGAAHWAIVRLAAPATRNVHAVGARLVLTSTHTHTTRWISAGSSSMFSGGPPEAHFGLGEDETYDLEVFWPDGTRTSYTGLGSNRVATITHL